MFYHNYESKSTRINNLGPGQMEQSYAAELYGIHERFNKERMELYTSSLSIDHGHFMRLVSKRIAVIEQNID